MYAFCMIARITGQVAEKEEKAVIVDVGGVGYRVMVLGRVLYRLKPGETVSFKIHHHVSEEAENLFGFEEKEYLAAFTLLLTVPGVGVKTAMGILEIASPKTLAQAVAEEDMALLTKVSGVGKKTAQRILVELKEKLKAPKHKVLAGKLQQEIMEALQSLGYTPAQARAAVELLPKTVKRAEEGVKLVLQQRAMAESTSPGLRLTSPS